MSVDKAGVNAIMEIRAAAKRVIERHVCGVGFGTKSAEVDLEGVLKALGGSLHAHAPHETNHRDRDQVSSMSSASSMSSMSSASTVAHTAVLQYADAAHVFRREIDRVGGGGYGGGGGRGGQYGFGGGAGGGGGFRDRDRDARGGGYGDRDRFGCVERGGGGGG